MFTDRRLLRHPYAWIALGFGTGLSKKAPGTVGSLLALLLWWWGVAGLPLWGQLLLILLAFALGVRASNWMIAKTGIQDPGYIVWDEFVGQWIAVLLLPKTVMAYALAFALFRWFDIVKPGPVGWADRRFGGGLGVMLDDVLAGALALLLGHLAIALFTLS